MIWSRLRFETRRYGGPGLSNRQDLWMKIF
jgi:hypothetical protein